ncbi:unnamed protein product [Closterium sp. NIES-65]|nr:unnamed protein product [Closterium sp. NIES-65]
MPTTYRANMCRAELRWFYVTDATGKVVKAFPCLFGQLGDFPESSRSTSTMQQGSHRPSSSCYIKETHLADLLHKSVVRTVELQRRVVEAIQSADDSKAAEKIKKRWSTHPVQCYLEMWNFAETTWGNVFLACAADLLHVLDGGMLPRMGKCFMVGKSKPERREFERRRKEQKKDTRASVAVQRLKPVLTKTSRRAHVDEDLDAVMWAYREAHGSDMDALTGCMVAAGIPTTTIEVGYDGGHEMAG